jgi:hypothetical protein
MPCLDPIGNAIVRVLPVVVGDSFQNLRRDSRGGLGTGRGSNDLPEMEERCSTSAEIASEPEMKARER